MTRRPGCYDRAPLQNKLKVQDGWIWETAHVRVPRMIEIADPMSKQCQHTKHAPNDPGCSGCLHQTSTI